MPNRSQIKIYGKIYNIKNTSSTIDLEKLASFVDAKMKELARAKASPSTMDLAILAALNIAQELFELKNDRMTNQVEIEKKPNKCSKC